MEVGGCNQSETTATQKPTVVQLCPAAMCGIQAVTSGNQRYYCLLFQFSPSVSILTKKTFSLVSDRIPCPSFSFLPFFCLPEKLTN